MAPGGEFKKAQAQAGTVPSVRTGSRDEFIARLSCARTASLALSVVQMPVEEKTEELFHLAEERYGAEKPSPFDPCAQSHSAPPEASASSLLNSASSRTTRSFVSAKPTIAPVSQASYVSYITTV